MGAMMETTSMIFEVTILLNNVEYERSTVGHHVY